jgi:hypothetical protein
MATTSPNAKPIQESGTHMVDKAKEIASGAVDRTKELGRQAADAADSATAKVGSGIERMADKLRDKGPHEGMLGTATSKVADTIQASGRYLREEGLSGMMDDVTDIIKRNPIPALLVGVGLGYLLAHAMRR